MMFKCCECGHLFEDGEQAVWEERHGFTSPPYEKWDGCPICRGGYEEVHQCKECGEWHTEDELWGGYCFDCLKEKCTQDVATDYIIDTTDYLEHFSITVLFRIDPPKETSWELRETLKEIVKEQATEKELKDYIFEDICTADDFSDWLNKREVK
jgi:hypothetical protein